jgi:hypothetical protein
VAVLPTEHFSHNEDEYCSAKAAAQEQIAEDEIYQPSLQAQAGVLRASAKSTAGVKLQAARALCFKEELVGSP